MSEPLRHLENYVMQKLAELDMDGICTASTDSHGITFRFRVKGHTADLPLQVGGRATERRTSLDIANLAIRTFLNAAKL